MTISDAGLIPTQPASDFDGKWIPFPTNKKSLFKHYVTMTFNVFCVLGNTLQSASQEKQFRKENQILVQLTLIVSSFLSGYLPLTSQYKFVCAFQIVLSSYHSFKLDGLSSMSLCQVFSYNRQAVIGRFRRHDPRRQKLPST